MNILISWLEDYIKTGLKPEQIAEILSNLGFPIEGFQKLGNQTVIDVEITSNRGDCLGYIGIARELAAYTGKELKMPSSEIEESGKNAGEWAKVEIAEPDLCGRYTARLIEGVKVGPSPEWVKKRLEAVGMRSVNNVVDATNYAMLETSQPPHAFDYDKINDGKIIVRRAKAGEQIVSIEGSKVDLQPQMLVIADAKRPVAIAGVMGGMDTEVSEETTNILLEDAYFDPVCVRQTSRKLALPSEAAFRFERDVDRERIEWASKRTAKLICELAGGTPAKGLVDVYPRKSEQKKVALRLSRLKKLLGVDIPANEVLEILSRLKFEPRGNGERIVCSVPSWRSDVYREADLIEEVARVYGYNKIPTEERIEIVVAGTDHRGKLIDTISSYLIGCGFYECITVSFIDQRLAELFNRSDSESHLSVKDVSVKGTNLLRQELIGSLFTVLKTNLNAGNSPCRLFEVADTFEPSQLAKEQLPNERTRIGIAADVSFRELKGVIEALVKKINREAEISFRPADLVWAQTGAEIEVNGKWVGTAGIANRAVRDNFNFKELTPVAAELDFETLMSIKDKVIELKPIPRFPEIERDLSIILNENYRWADITKAIRSNSPKELEQINFVEVYRGKNIPKAKKSVTLSLRFRDEQGTLTHNEVDEYESKIVKALSDSVGAELRTL